MEKKVAMSLLDPKWCQRKPVLATKGYYWNSCSDEHAEGSSFTKWRGRNFVGFVEFPSFPLTYMQKKKIPYGTGVIRFCPCVRHFEKVP